MDTETMRPSVSSEQVAFLFSFEAGEKQQRARFESTKLKKGEDHEAKSGGFRLVQISEEPENSGSLALPSWSSGLCKMTNPFLLRLQTSISFMGHRRALMVVITALWLREVNVQGRTSKVGVLVEGKMKGD
ncbi:hypothetical protein GQ607_004734 [Colletotrichum asianum]|uniref:Uncharacterized protein n=1 Tax=Colletotrichum asianum TaxID=702518 RepID=A0A8H3WP14_9PEZI|nr:hypothetical protein GQ607_004734 [Colletotrichum asianum]